MTFQEDSVMAEGKKRGITIEAVVMAPITTVWQCWTTPSDIIHWNNASPDWHTPRAENDLRPGGRFSYRMEARDGSAGFDFDGSYDRVIHHQTIAYTIGDGRKVEIRFADEGGQTRVVETFEAEETHSIELQRSGWQAILDNFKRYVETRYRKGL
jgi:uncharacterized protein YndB with AHSA1/START domain